ncbi:MULTISPECIES: OmpA family protein [unclassified Vibrio]|jgi:outer membrane protein OmpA-like peptidoglycan-associated protein|uniref:OmpA family protein n=1 Tax=unclassified Vibrio TaxID=2614977 RepID=UPI001F0617F4|nr:MULTISPECIES: OmpA family protein [unclassified Vibrio]USD99183.1 OmpA family protein [Vibrio sp. SCSIO 43133]
MKKLVIGALVMSMLPYSLAASAGEGQSVYCDNTFNEFQHSVTVGNITGIAQHRKGFLQIEQKSDDSDLKKLLAGKSSLALSQSGCTTWIGDEHGKAKQGGLVARLHFGFDQANLTPMGDEALNRLADTLGKQASNITIDGHTDSTGPEGYNQALGLKRALTTSDGLISKGVDKNHIVVRSFGETKPIATNSTTEGRAQNRRSEIWVSSGSTVKSVNK